ncbi:MAG TPA: class III extradiol ring-cleavage dioxygenase [Nakamurella sp.]|nr:class III extradiol ring-cleavage dioxygenase [Nakamurella sp.]
MSTPSLAADRPASREIATGSPQDHETPARMPVLYLSHGAPPLADDRVWTDQLAGWGAQLPRPSSILVVSAHWEAAPVAVGATEQVPLTYDFWGFPERYYQVRYDAPGAPDLAERVRALLDRPGNPVHQDPARGLDHGAYVPLVEMYPQADIPVLQVSMPSLDPQELFALGRRLGALRDEGVLIIGSGFTTHNLREARFGDTSGSAPEWGVEFDDWARRTVEAGDIDAVLDFQHTAPAAQRAHPRTEHFAPLFVALGATADTGVDAASVIDGFWYGLAKRSFQFN